MASETTPAGTDSSGRSRGPSPGKRRDILDAAFALFLASGFAATTLEQVAEVAGVSRQTVYAHFGGDGDVKESLFRAIVERQVGRRHERHPLDDAMPFSDDVHADLQTYARDHLELVMRPELLRLRRMLIGEAERFPALARSWFEHGPRQSIDLFAGWFTILDERGVLEVADPNLSAGTFNWAVLSTPLNEAMATISTAADHGLARYADEGVRVFLAAHGHLRDPGCRTCTANGGSTPASRPR